MTDYDAADEAHNAHVAKLATDPEPEQTPYAVDCSGQSLVWALTASQHATELMQYRTAKKEREDSGRVPTADEFLIEDRAIAYHQEMHTVAKGLADMWALTASVQPFMTDESDQSEASSTHVD